MDFNKMVTSPPSRAFHQGFLTIFGKGNLRTSNLLPYYAGVDFQPADSIDVLPKECRKMEKRPTFILANDDIFNLGHYMNDVMGIWSMLVLSNQYHPENDSLLINIDAYRQGGPAGAARLMVPSSPDEHGPYSAQYYGKWFHGEKNVLKADSFQKKKVCFEQLYLMPVPGLPWFWNEWGRDDECSMEAASPLYQSFNVFLRQNLLDSYYSSSSSSSTSASNGKTTKKKLVFPSERDYYHIVIEVRSIKKNTRNNHSSGRFIRNLPALIAALNSIQNSSTAMNVPIKVTAQDFSRLSFEEQIHLAHSASVLVSMHGAGTTHIFHMALGDRKCCGLIEMFPDKSVDLYTAKGYSNLARMMGFYHSRYEAEEKTTTDQGTTVNVEKVKELTTEVLRKMIVGKGTCLHNVKDTRFPIFKKPLAFE
jgi:PIN domain nuclease of toxin-antitoxin system